MTSSTSGVESSSLSHRFLVLATSSENGLDCSPKGGPAGFVKLQDNRTLLLPDWSGNNRIDGLQNIVTDPRVGLVFFFPGRNEVFRVNGTADVTAEPTITGLFEHEGRTPRTIMVITVSEAYIHCGRAVTFGGLWNADTYLTDETMPSTGDAFRAHVAYSRSNRDAGSRE